jgi:hypothetical protein
MLSEKHLLTIPFSFAFRQDFHAVFNFALPPERRDYSFLTDGVISIKDNNSVRLHDEREDDIAMFETPTSSGSYLFYVMMRPCYRDGWRGFIIYDTADLALEVVMRSLDSQTYTWPRRFGDETEKLEKRIRNENRSVSDSFVLSFAQLGSTVSKRVTKSSERN